MNLVKFLKVWLFPIAVGVTYWLFDTLVDLFSPIGVGNSLYEVLFPKMWSVEMIFRTVMLSTCIYGGRIFERSVYRLKQLERQLFLSEYAVENTQAFEMLWTDATGRFIKVNNYAAERLQYTKKELLKLSIFDVATHETPELWQKLLSVLKKRGSASYLTQHRKKDGSFMDVIIHLQYLKTQMDQYQFAFVCDAFRCPMTAATITTPCGQRPTLNLREFLQIAELEN